ncbi:MAG: hypothetical protein IKM61_03295 [Eubacteriaceae bacterium]|nr:hypothetical protein [Eubacteriaceae bacterium]
MSAKKRIRIVNKTKFITAVTLLVLFIVMFVFLVSSLTGDKIEKQIEKLEDGKVTVLDRRFESSVKDESIVEIGQTVTFRLVYYYQTETREIRSFDVTEDITITLADETKDTPSSVATKDGNSITVLPTVKATDTVRVTLSHKYADDTEFRFSVGDTEVIE